MIQLFSSSLTSKEGDGGMKIENFSPRLGQVWRFGTRQRWPAGTPGDWSGERHGEHRSAAWLEQWAIDRHCTARTYNKYTNYTISTYRNNVNKLPMFYIPQYN